VNDDDPILPGHNEEEAFRIAQLISGFLKDDLSEKERDELDDWVNASMSNQRLFEELTDKKNIDKWLNWKKRLKVEEALQRVRAKIHDAPEKPTSLIKLLLPYISVAALLTLIITSVIILKNDHPKKMVANTNTLIHDIAPGTDQATLTLGDGKKILLDRVKNGGIANEDNSLIVKNDSGKISYGASANTPKEILYNILSTPKGGQFQLVLPDGSKVWLNAASSLKYPTSFTGEKRQVELTGEGYFEVAKDAAHPFLVTANGTTTEVLGTHFNINAYPDEATINITLAEGSVRVNSALTIRPGEQAQVDATGKIIRTTADIRTITGWKDGEFVFTNTPVKEVMLQVARWYDATISYTDNVSEHFNTTISRNVPVSKLLHLLEATGSVHFSVEKKNIEVRR
jgi:ferric-dicitrate binding protein FerR (iron transport regulator)